MFDSAADVNRYFNNKPRNTRIIDAVKNGTLYKGYYWRYIE